MNRIERKQAQTVGEALRQYLKAYHLTTGLNTQRIWSAWDNASGAGKYTIRRFYRDGTLHITLSSSVVRSQLMFQKDALIARMNSILREDTLFCRDDPNVGFIKELKLK